MKYIPVTKPEKLSDDLRDIFYKRFPHSVTITLCGPDRLYLEGIRNALDAVEKSSMIEEIDLIVERIEHYGKVIFYIDGYEPNLLTENEASE